METPVNCDKHNCVHTLIEKRGLDTPDAIAIASESEQYSYLTLNQKANQLARYLQKLGVKPESLVGICVERSPIAIVALLAVLKVGGAYVPIDPTYPRERVALMVEDSQLNLILTQQQYAPGLSTDAAVVCLDADWSLIEKETTDNLDVAVQGSNLAYVIYTSGSTGKPKGVMIEHHSLSNLVGALSEQYALTAQDRVLQFASISFDVAVEEIFVTLAAGATLVLRSQEMLRSVPAFLSACEEKQLTVLNLPTAFWHKLCAEFPKVKLPECVRLVVIGSERAIPKWLLAWQANVPSHVRLVNAYGPTEATVTSTLCDLAGPQAVNAIESRVIPIGWPIRETQAYVLNETLEPVSAGESGELYLAGAGLARGYLNRPDLTSERFIEWNNGSHGAVRLYKTGDTVRARENGCLEYLDRIDHQEKIRGFRIELPEIESVLSQHPAVLETAVIAREDVPGEKRLAAYIVPRLDQPEVFDSENVEAEQLDYWRTIHDSEHFNEVEEHWDPTFNISGWLDSYTGEPIADAAMKEWLDQTIDRMLSLQPKRVLEIGCGTGLILFRVAPHCETYVGTDFSKTALSYIEQQLPRLNLPQVSLQQRPAHQLEAGMTESFDTIFINSVIQYFPTVNYLVDVVETALNMLEPGGSLFIGDVRSHALLPAFATALELDRAADDCLGDELLRRVQKRLGQEEELTLHPDFFYALQQRFPQIGQVKVEIKHGEFVNELSEFRYDVTLQRVAERVEAKETMPALDGAEATPEPEWLDWQEQNLSLELLKRWLQQLKPQALGVQHIPNGGVYAKVLATQQLFARKEHFTAAELRQLADNYQGTGINPQQLCKLAEELGYGIRLSWSRGSGVTDYPEAYYDVILQLENDVSSIDFPVSTELKVDSLEDYANDPQKAKLDHSLIPQFRSFLQDKLPSYMVPAAFVLMDALPLTPNGKVNRRALPAIGSERPELKDAFIAPRTPLEKELSNLWSMILGIMDIGINDNFFELGGDSLQTTQLISRTEESYKVVIPLIDFFPMPTIAGLARLIEGTDSEKQREYMTLEQLQAEVQLDESLQLWETETLQLSDAEPVENIFMTGSTGFIGSFLLHEILQTTTATVYCLLRGDDAAQARQKLVTALERCGSLPRESYSKIIPVLGDLSQPKLGLGDAEFNQLAETVDVIYHSAASVNLLYPYQALHSTNVSGTHEVLRLAFSHHGKPVHYVSTLDVFESLASTGASMFHEEDCIAQGDGMSGGYAQSKWVAERLMMEACHRGLPIHIYRPGMVSGHSCSGMGNTTDLISRFVQSVVELKQAPDLDLMLDMTPVDYVSRSIVHLSQQSTYQGKVFHLINPQPLPLSLLVETLQAQGHVIETIPYAQWKESLRNQPNALQALATVVTEDIAEGHQTRLELWLSGTEGFGRANAIAGLADSAVSCPPADLTLLKTYLNFFESQGFMPESQLAKSL